MYATIQDLRDEGVSEARASDSRILPLIAQASQLIDKATGWFFEPRKGDYYLDGRDSPTLELPAPPLRVEHLFIDESEVFLDDDRAIVVGAPVSASFDAPRITLRHGIVFPQGIGNINIQGRFGYTEPNGTKTGMTPPAIRQACIMLVLRWLDPFAGDASLDARNRSRIIEERTRDQSYKLDRVSAKSSSFSLTGEPEVDTILWLYRRPMGLGAV